MKPLLQTIRLFTCLLVSCQLPSIAQDAPIPSAAISYKEIGPKFHIEGKFGPLFQEFTVKATVVAPPDKRDQSEDNKSVWLDITLVEGKVYRAAYIGEHVYTNEKFAVGSVVELVLKEKAELVSGDSIDLILSNPNRTMGKMVCRLSLHHCRTVSKSPPKESHENKRHP